MGCYNAWLFKIKERDSYTIKENIAPEELLVTMKNGGFSFAAGVTVPGTCLCTLRDASVSKKDILEVLEKYSQFASLVKTIKTM